MNTATPTLARPALTPAKRPLTSLLGRPAPLLAILDRSSRTTNPRLASNSHTPRTPPRTIPSNHNREAHTRTMLLPQDRHPGILKAMARIIATALDKVAAHTGSMGSRTMVRRLALLHHTTTTSRPRRKADIPDRTPKGLLLDSHRTVSLRMASRPNRDMEDTATDWGKRIGFEYFYFVLGQ